MSRYKTKLRIPTEMYAYIEIDFEGTPEEVVEKYREFTKLVKPQAGLDAKEWQIALDHYLNENTLNSEVYESMSNNQKDIIQEIKRSVKRIKSKADG